MNEFEKLLAYLKIAYQNFSTLHRHIKGAGFFTIHEELDGWQRKISYMLDDLAEIGITLNVKEPSISDAVLAFSAELLPIQPYDCKSALKAAANGIARIILLCQAAEAHVPADVENKLQEYEYDWKKIGNYKIAAALGKGSDIEDDD